MITCVVHYTIDPAQIVAFERFAREWMRLVAKHGGIHHGYFLPAEGASDKAEALFSFESLAALTKEYGVAAMLASARLGRIAPVSREMVLNFIAQTSLGLPRSY